MHIVIIRAGNALAIDGVSTYIWQLASALTEAELEVTVCSGFSNVNLGVRSHVERYFGANLKENYISLKSGNFHGLIDFLFTWSVKGSGLMKELDPDIIHINGAVPLLCTEPKIATYHGIMNFDLNLSTYKCIFNALYDRVIYRTFSKIIAVSHKAREEFLRYVQASVSPRVIPPMIKIKNYNTTTEPSNREDAILHRGTQSRKNLRATLLAFSHLKEKIPHVRLYVVGSMQNVTMSSRSLGLSLRDVDVVGKISKQEMNELYARVRVTFFPSYYEAFGYVALESLASGTPIIASYAVANELVRPGYNGFYTSPNDPKAMANYAYRLITNEGMWASMSKNAIKVAEEFSSERILPRILSIYKATLSKPSMFDI